MDRQRFKPAARFLGNQILPKISGLRPVHNALSSLVVAAQFRTERRAAKGEHRPQVNRPSVIHFSVNKSATQFVKRILFAAARDTGFIPVNLSAYASWSDIPYLDSADPSAIRLAQRAFCTKGHVYSPFGGLVTGLTSLEHYRVILVVRDPRDVLTSEYFSTAFSHPLPGSPPKTRALLARRSSAIDVGIDRYVLSRVDALLQTYQGYYALLRMANVLVTTYEQLVANFEKWLDELLAFGGLVLSPRHRAHLIDETNLGAQGDVWSKRRQIAPGDHLRQLKPATIKELTLRLKEPLELYGYPRTP